MKPFRIAQGIMGLATYEVVQPHWKGNKRKKTPRADAEKNEEA